MSDFLIVVSIIIGLINLVACGLFCQKLATAKGYPQKYFYWIGVFFNIMGLLFVVGLPSLKK